MRFIHCPVFFPYCLGVGHQPEVNIWSVDTGESHKRARVLTKPCPKPRHGTWFSSCINQYIDFMVALDILLKASGICIWEHSDWEVHQTIHPGFLWQVKLKEWRSGVGFLKNNGCVECCGNPKIIWGKQGTSKTYFQQIMLAAYHVSVVVRGAGGISENTTEKKSLLL